MSDPRIDLDAPHDDAECVSCSVPPDRRAFLRASATAVAAALLGLGARRADALAPLAFWVKMGLVALLLLNGLVMTRTESTLRRAPNGDASAWGRLRTTAVVSGVLWLATLLAGVALTNA